MGSQSIHQVIIVSYLDREILSREGGVVAEPGIVRARGVIRGKGIDGHIAVPNQVVLAYYARS